MIAEAALVVPSFGYRSTMLPVFDAGGARLSLNADLGGIAVGEQSRLLLSDGTSVPNLFGIGLGTGYKLPASMGGDKNWSRYPCDCVVWRIRLVRGWDVWISLPGLLYTGDGGVRWPRLDDKHFVEAKVRNWPAGL